MKRKVSLCEVLNETIVNGMEVAKMVAFHGFRNVQNISMLLSCCKVLYEWGNKNAVMRGVYIFFSKVKNMQPPVLKFCANMPIPRRTLLELHSDLVIKSYECDLFIADIEECSFSCIVNDYPVYAVRFGAPNLKEYYYEHFLKRSLIEPFLQTIIKDGRILQIDFCGKLIKN